MVNSLYSSSESPDSNPDSCDESQKRIEEYDDSEYENLVYSIQNLVLESSCVDDLEDRGVPVKLYIHQFLEKVCNHKSASIEPHDFCPPGLTFPLDTCSPHAGGGNSQVSLGDDYQANGGNKKRKNGQKRAMGRDSDGNSPDDDGADGSEGVSNTPKKQKTGNIEELSCPFRKRNPIRFNVRDHSQCALQFYADLARLK